MIFSGVTYLEYPDAVADTCLNFKVNFLKVTEMICFFTNKKIKRLFCNVRFCLFVNIQVLFFLFF